MWLQVKFKDGLVWAECDENGQLAAKSGRVAIRYQNSSTARIYQAALANIKPLAGSVPENGPAAGPSAPQKFGKAGMRTAAQASKANMHAQNMIGLLPDDTIICYVDGASRGNPGQAACGYLVKWPQGGRQVSKGVYLGRETNNFAELMAVKLALGVLVENSVSREANVAFLTDSKYVHGLFSANWSAKANTELVAEIRSLLKNFPRARFHWVPGHAGVEGNEIVDLLANQALDNAQTTP